MNRTLTLVERLLSHGRTLHRMGVHGRALRLLGRLAKFRNLPDHVTRETRLRLAVLNGRCGKPGRARRHLSAVLADHPEDARLHHLMGRLAAGDLRCDPRRAAAHFLRAWKLDPKNANYLSAFAVFALRCGERKAALGAARRAYRLSPDNARVLRRYLKVLRRLGRVAEGRRVLHDGLFRHFRAEWFRKLHRDFESFVLYRSQLAARRRQAEQERQPEARCVLPLPVLFRPVAEAAAQLDGVRVDRPSVLPVPHRRAPQRRPDRRRAQ